MLRKERSSCLRLMSFEIGSKIFSPKLLSPRYKNSRLDKVEEEFITSIEPARLFPHRSSCDKKGMVMREKGIVPEK